MAPAPDPVDMANGDKFVLQHNSGKSDECLGGVKYCLSGLRVQWVMNIDV